MPRGARLRVAAVAALGCGLAVAPLAGAATGSPHGAVGYPQLAATTTVTAARSAWGLVDIPRPVTVRTEGVGVLTGLRLHGAGRIIGLGLVSTDSRVGFVELQFGSCWTAGCRPAHRRALQIATSWNTRMPPDTGVGTAPANRFELPAGRYVLSLYADGAPVRATLRLPGLDGDQRLALRLDRHTQETTPDIQRVGAGPLTTATQSHASGTVGTSTIVLGMAHRKDASAHVHDEDWWCFYSQPPPGDEAAPYCPGGSGVGIGLTFVTLDFRAFSYGLAIESGPGVDTGRIFQGVSDSGVQDLGAVHDSFLWADAGLPRQGSG